MREYVVRVSEISVVRAVIPAFDYNILGLVHLVKSIPHYITATHDENKYCMLPFEILLLLPLPPLLV